MTQQSIEAQILAAEQRRGAALLANDLAALAAMVPDSLIHVHSSGRVEDKQAWLDGLRDRLAFITFDRRDLHVHMLGEVAMATGYLEQMIRFRTTGEERLLKLRTVQIWLPENGRWLQHFFQATSVS